MKQHKVFTFKFISVLLILVIIQLPLGPSITIALAQSTNIEDQKSRCQVQQENKAWFGVGLKNMSPSRGKELATDNVKGIEIGQIMQQSPAEISGLKEGDIIKKIDGNLVFEPNEVIAIINAHDINSKIDVEFVRNAELHNSTITLYKKPIDIIIYECADRNYKDKNFKEAYLDINKLANRGIARGQHMIGVMNYKGEGVSENKQEAARWYDLAARQGDADSQFLLADMYLKGDGVKKDIQKALELYVQIAKKGDLDAQYIMGKINEYGQGIPINTNEALKWYTLAAEKGHNQSICALAGMFLVGKGVVKDINKAFSLYKESGQNGYNVAYEKLGSAYLTVGESYFSGKDAPQSYIEAEKYYKLSQQLKNSYANNFLDNLYLTVGLTLNLGQINQGIYEETLVWYKSVAEQGNVNAQYFLGELYTFGKNTTQNTNEAIYWYKKAADQDHVKAEYGLGSIYYLNESIRDYQKAFQWYTKAANGNNPSAQLALGEMYALGQGVDKDLDKAIKWTRASVELDKDKSISQSLLGTLLFMQNNYVEAKEWLEKSSSQDNIKAKAILGVMLMFGLGTDQNLERAAALLQFASDNGVGQIDPLLALLYIDGTSMAKDVEKGLSILKKSSESNNGFSDYLLGVVYHEGAGVPRDLDTAKHYYIRSFDKGYSAAKYQLSKIKQDTEQMKAYNDNQFSKDRTTQINESSKLPSQEMQKILNSTGNVLGEILLTAAKVAIIGAVIVLGSYANAQASRQQYYGNPNLQATFSNKTPSSSVDNVSNWSSTKQNETGCTSDFSCGTGERCVKAPLQSAGVCMKTVSGLGVQTYENHKTGSVGPNMNLNGECSFDTDCPIGFRCNNKFKSCVKR